MLLACKIVGARPHLVKGAFVVVNEGEAEKNLWLDSFWWSSDFDLRHRNFWGQISFSSSSLGTWESGYAAALIKKEGEEFMRGLTISDRPPLSWWHRPKRCALQLNISFFSCFQTHRLAPFFFIKKRKKGFDFSDRLVFCLPTQFSYLNSCRQVNYMCYCPHRFPWQKKIVIFVKCWQAFFPSEKKRIPLVLLFEWCVSVSSVKKRPLFGWPDLKRGQERYQKLFKCTPSSFAMLFGVIHFLF